MWLNHCISFLIEYIILISFFFKSLEDVLNSENIIKVIDNHNMSLYICNVLNI